LDKNRNGESTSKHHAVSTMHYALTSRHWDCRMRPARCYKARPGFEIVDFYITRAASSALRDAFLTFVSFYL